MTISRWFRRCGALAVAVVLSMIAATTVTAGGEAGSDVEAEVVEWLDRLEERGREIETLSGKISHSREDELLGEQQIRLGQVWYVAADEEADEPARFAVHFEQIVIDDAMRQQDRQYVFDGEWLAEVQTDRRLFHRRQVVRPGEHFDPLQIDGPFPVPIGQKREDVLARFVVEKIEPDEEQEGQVGLRLEPREDRPRAEGEAEFAWVEMWFDRETLLPERVATRERQYRTEVVIYDKEVDAMEASEIAERFDTTPPDPGEGWRVEVTPFEQE